MQVPRIRQGRSFQAQAVARTTGTWRLALAVSLALWAAIATIVARLIPG
ncbi:hypothetical protein [Phreatobacter sp.]